MTRHLLGERLFSTDLLFKNFFDRDVDFGSFMEAKPDYPVDVFIQNENLCFDIACVGLEKDDIKVSVEGNTLKVAYKKPSIESNPSDEEAPSYMHRGIARRSFDMGWKVSPDYDLTDLDATMKNGLLQITVPKSEKAKAKFIEIK
jgi:HSP20 family molecular chaperone IbpA